ncbi:MAG: hypothetical protein JOZ98_14280 [Solirubrobacterales bacterium]|nr:hypothetical protein [Solirubrobacterales bacterium]
MRIDADRRHQARGLVHGCLVGTDADLRGRGVMTLNAQGKVTLHTST